MPVILVQTLYRLFSKKTIQQHVFLIQYVFKWSLVAALVGLLAGSASALFLILLDLLTNWRENHVWVISFLPLAGLAIGLMYYYLGKEVVKGNNQLIEEVQNPKKIVPLIMAPLIFVGTLITHLFGGSAGREGTAVQIGGAIADQLTKVFKLKPRDRKVLIICGISAGFSSVFGTPLAGAVFGLEVFLIGSMVYGAILPSFLAAIIANMVTNAWGADHIHYTVNMVPDMNAILLSSAVCAGVFFGLAARFFSNITHFLQQVFIRISYPPFRPFVGGTILVGLFWVIGNTRYNGLGIPVIIDSFVHVQLWYIFLLKLLLTALTLACGFKGGEVTPLFFIGATLGSFLSIFLPLPVALLAAMGFAAVFAGAANTPIACIMMGIELFGIESGIYIAIACVASYLFSGHTGIYHSQIIGHAKHGLLMKEQGRSLLSLKAIGKKKFD